MMWMRYHEISEAGHRVLNPFLEPQIDLLGRVSRLGAGSRVLDVACGKGEMLVRWAADHHVVGVGVDSHAPFLELARARAGELGVQERVRFELGDAADHLEKSGGYDVVSCLGASWIGGGLVGTVRMLTPALAPGGVVIVGEPYWKEPPPDAARAAMGGAHDAFVELGDLPARFEDAGVELVEMVLASTHDWDRYAASQWWQVSDWLRADPDDPDAPAVREFLDRTRTTYLQFGHRYFGWGAFVLRPIG